jgi:hypothetical protein
MIRVNVLYPRKEGARFDWAYYTSTHILRSGASWAPRHGISAELWYCRRLSDLPAFVAMAHLPSVRSGIPSRVYSSRGRNNGDIAKYTSIEPIIQISEVKVAQ